MIKKYWNARYPFLWVQTTEEDRFIRTMRKDFDEDIAFYNWDIVGGFSQFVKNDDTWIWESMEKKTEQGRPQQQPNPQIALATVIAFPDKGVIFMKDYHKFFDSQAAGSVAVIRQAINIKDKLKGQAKTIVFVSPHKAIPLDMAHDITYVDFPLPDKPSLKKKMELLAQDNGIEVPKDSCKFTDALLGMPDEAAENALALSLSVKGAFDVKILMDERASFLESSGVLKYGRFKEKLDDLYELSIRNLTRFVLGTVNNPKANGVIIYSPPGCGKSHFAKAVANFLQKTLLVANFGSLRDKYLGATEAKTSMMFQTIKSFGRPIIFADEVDKAITGTGSSDTDGGAGSRIFGEWLKFMQDENNAYWICTCNSLKDILHLSGGAIMRRFNGIFFIDMPSQEECVGISKIWNKIESVEIPENYNFDGFTGADIAKLATTMSMLGCQVDEARDFVLPYGLANPNELAEIKEQASNVCIPAGIKQAKLTSMPKRRVAR